MDSLKWWQPVRCWLAFIQVCGNQGRSQVGPWPPPQSKCCFRFLGWIL